MKMERINELLNPRSVAVIGASNIPGKWGFGIVFNILTGGYRGKVYPVNPSEKSVLGLKCYPDVKSIKEKVDLAIITVPREKVPPAIIDCGKKGVKWAVVVSSNYAEVGEEGKRAQDELVKIAEDCGVYIIGPNTMGIYSSTPSLHAMGSPFRAKKGKIGLISQSGNIGVQIMGRGARLNLGFSRFFGSGNEAMLTAAEFLEILMKDDETEVIALYIEGIRKGRKFFETLKECVCKKPVVILKSAKTEFGRRAALSHTGAMATDELVASSAFKQAGAVEISNTEELIDLLSALYTMPIPPGNRVCIITMGGGWGVVCAEACDREGLLLPPLPEGKVKELDEMLPPFWSKGNPVDLVGTLRRGVQLEVLKTLADVPEYDAFILMGYLTETLFSGSRIYIEWFERVKNLLKASPSLIFKLPIALTFGRKKAKREFKERGRKVSAFDIRERKLWKDIYVINLMKEIMKKYRKPVIAVIGSPEASFDIMSEYSVPVFSSPEKAAFVLARASTFSVKRRGELLSASIPFEEMKKFIKENEMDEFKARRFLKLAGVQMVDEGLAQNEDEAVEIAEKLGYPIVMKLVSPDISHKTELGVVKVNLKNRDEVVNAFRDIIGKVKNFEGIRIKGVAVQKMIRDGPEIIIGIHTDPTFGKVILFGSGGTGTELYKDVAVRIPPLTEKDFHEMVKETKISRIFYEGFRGRKYDINNLLKTVSIFSEIALKFEEIYELEVNPFIVTENGIIGVDAVISLTP